MGLTRALPYALFELFSKKSSQKGAGAPRIRKSFLRQPQVTRQYNDVLSWADMYAESPMDVKKMIVAQLISAVRVSRDYRIEIDFKISERQFGLDQEQQAERKPKQRKRRSDPAL